MHFSKMIRCWSKRCAPVLFYCVGLLGLAACEPSSNPDETGGMNAGNEQRVNNSSGQNNIKLGKCWFEVPDKQLIKCGYYHPADFAKAELPFVILRNNHSLQTEHTLIYLPGGPGSGSYLTEEGIQYWTNWYKESQLQVDLVLLDRRGVGLAKPNWSCAEYDLFSRQVLTRDVTLAEELAEGYQIIEACYGKLRQENFSSKWFSTRQSAEDVASVLTAMNYSGWNILGVSYGTRLALAISEYYPEQVTSLILDSLYTTEQGQLTDWPGILDGAFKRFFSACQRFSDCESPEVLEALFWKVLKQLKQVPVTVTAPSWYSEAPYQVLVNDQRLLAIVFASFYDRYLYPEIVTTLKELTTYHTEGLTRLVETFVNSAFDPAFSDWVFYAVECRDNPRVSAQLYAESVAQYPQWQAYTESLQAHDVCKVINPDDQQVLFSSTTLGSRQELGQDIPVLLLAGELDPITPAADAKKVLQSLSLGQGVFVHDYGHAVESSLPCGPRLVADFIAHPRAAVDLTCAEADIVRQDTSEK